MIDSLEYNPGTPTVDAVKGTAVPPPVTQKVNRFSGLMASGDCIVKRACFSLAIRLGIGYLNI